MIYLASKSPRRQELLQQLGVEFQLLLPPQNDTADEPQLLNETAQAYVQRTAQDKVQQAYTYAQTQDWPCLPILGADTVVIHQDQVLRKPQSQAQAIQTLQVLSGTSHEVHTALALYYQDSLYTALSITHVFFRHLTDSEILAYCQSQEPYDKAGAYGIQGKAGIFIERIEGSYTGVMGLPLYETALLLKRANISIL